MTPCVGFINSVLYVYKGPPLCTKTSGTLSEPDPAASGASADRGTRSQIGCHLPEHRSRKKEQQHANQSAGAN